MSRALVVVVAIAAAGCTLPKTRVTRIKRVDVAKLRANEVILVGRVSVVFNGKNRSAGCGLALYRKAGTVFQLDRSGLVAWKTVRPLDHTLRLHAVEIPERGRVDLPDPPALVPLGRKGQVFYFGTLKIVIKQKLTSKAATSVYGIRPIPKHIGLKNEASRTLREAVKLNGGLRGSTYFNVLSKRRVKIAR